MVRSVALINGYIYPRAIRKDQTENHNKANSKTAGMAKPSLHMFTPKPSTDCVYDTADDFQ